MWLWWKSSSNMKIKSVNIRQSTIWRNVSIHNMKQNLTLFKHPSNHQTELLHKSVTDQPKQRSDWNLISKVIMIFDFLASIYCTVQVKKHQLHTCMTTNGILQVIQSSNFKFTWIIWSLLVLHKISNYH